MQKNLEKIEKQDILWLPRDNTEQSTKKKGKSVAFQKKKSLPAGPAT